MSQIRIIDKDDPSVKFDEDDNFVGFDPGYWELVFGTGAITGISEKYISVEIENKENKYNK